MGKLIKYLSPILIAVSVALVFWCVFTTPEVPTIENATAVGSLLMWGYAIAAVAKSYIPAFLDIIQDYTLDSMEKDANAYGGLTNYTANIVRSEDMKIAFSKDDLAVSLDSLEEGTDSFGKDMLIMEEEEADALMADGAEGTIVSYVVAPFEPQNGMYCYKMLIDTQNHKLYYYKRHKITDKAGPGFLKDDLKRIYYVR